MYGNKCLKERISTRILWCLPVAIFCDDKISYAGANVVHVICLTSIFVMAKWKDKWKINIQVGKRPDLVFRRAFCGLGNLINSFESKHGTQREYEHPPELVSIHGTSYVRYCHANKIWPLYWPIATLMYDFIREAVFQMIYLEMRNRTSQNSLSQTRAIQIHYLNSGLTRE